MSRNIDYKAIIQQIVNWLRKKAESAQCKGVVVGLSGGVDSAVVAALCKKAFGDNCLALILPCHSIPEDAEDADFVAEHLGITTKEIDLTPVLDAMILQLEGKRYDEMERNTALINLKPRLRMMALYYFANKMNYLVVGTGNKSEILMGYFTKYGDGGTDILPLGDFTKTEVYKLAEALGIPQRIIQKTPSAGLFEGQTDEGEMGISYEDLDFIIECLETGRTSECDEGILHRVKSTIRKMDHKTQPPPKFEIEES